MEQEGLPPLEPNEAQPVALEARQDVLQPGLYGQPEGLRLALELALALYGQPELGRRDVGPGPEPVLRRPLRPAVQAEAPARQ